jgi:ParB family chromosome partitioning protein
MTTEFRHIRLDQISFADRARDLDLAWVEALAAMIRNHGLILPITVRHIAEGYRLVSGMHRFEAFRRLGAEEIPCLVSTAPTDDEARLEEVMENLGRQELKALDRCRHLSELKKVWERMYPETAHGKASPKTQKMRLSSDAPEIFGFARATADKIGLSKRAIEQDVTIWNRLSSASRLTLVGMKMATKMTELKALSEQKHPRQAQILDLIQSEAHPDIQNVAEALFHLESGREITPIEKQFRAVRTAFSKLPDAALDMVVSAEVDRVMASLKRLGRI